MASGGASVRILVVDDRLDMAEMIADDLRDRGYDGVAVSSGRDALLLLRSERFDVLVTDLRMPEIDGLQLLRASRDLDPTRPVIVMTAFEALESAMKTSEYGGCHYVTKPFRLDLLAQLVERAIESR